MLEKEQIIPKRDLDVHELLEKLAEGALIQPGNANKLSWEDTYKAMAQEGQDEWVEWQELDMEELS